jgi:pimeloyl-ACP methyl ester carboxylesterase
MSIIQRNNVLVSGRGEKTIVFSHGFGCDQNMWRLVAPEFENEFRTVLFDHVGAGRSDLGAYDPQKYGSLQGYADDVVEIGGALELERAAFAYPAGVAAFLASRMPSSRNYRSDSDRSLACCEGCASILLKRRMDRGYAQMRLLDYL